MDLYRRASNVGQFSHLEGLTMTLITILKYYISVQSLTIVAPKTTILSTITESTSKIKSGVIFGTMRLPSCKSTTLFGCGFFIL